MWRKAPAFWAVRGAVSTLLLPAAGIYGVAAALRQSMTTPQRVGVPVICIGNLVVGGAGKTPVAIAVAGLVRHLGVQPFFISRGYGGRLRGPVLVDAAHHTAADVGDEPLLLAAHAPTIMAKDRIAGATFAAARGAGAIILDDGFQNPRLHKDFSLLVVDAAYGFGNGRLLPAGPLREPAASGMARADVVIAMDGDVAAERPVFHAALVPDAAAGALRGCKVAGFAGIGRPEKFHATLARLGADVVSFTAFPDHHFFRERELTALHHTANGALLVTTAKDAVRLPSAWRGRVTVVAVRAVISEAEQLTQLLRGVLHAA